MKITSGMMALLIFGGVIVRPAPCAFGSDAPTPIGNFGPTGIDITVLPDRTLSVASVQADSPAVGVVAVGDIITLVNGQAPLAETSDAPGVFMTFKQLAAFITAAEATDGRLRFTVKSKATGALRDAELTIPVLGSYSATWPLNCEKSSRIIRQNADYIASVAGLAGEGLAKHDLYSGFAILMLLSTGEGQDLDVVRKIYKRRMATFEGPDTGYNNWHNGVQGIAVCEYYLRTGDASVMPLIEAICESLRKYQVYGGWSHFAAGINPQYTAGGHMNAAGVQNLTTLLLAKQCGAKVNHDTLTSALHFFYRFAGHGDTPYGDHRPESGVGSNGKTEMLALAMNAAARAENGGVYAMARDKCALTALYDYPALLQGHTGGNGAKWHGIAAALMAEKKPRLYRNQLEEKKWFFELSRRHTGAMGASGTGRYDAENFGYATGLSLTAPRKTLQITGAPASPHAKSFRLPPRPWGRRDDLAFFSIEGGPAYQAVPYLPPHVELAKIADADAEALRQYASHPEHFCREAAAKAIREKTLYGLIEQLLASDDPLARQTACKAINDFQPWQLRFSIGTRSRDSIDPVHFTPTMFELLMKIVDDPTSALWSVDQALCALTVASTAQTKSRLNDILPWVEHSEWMLNESATIALTPAMVDEDSLDKILPMMIDSMSNNMHIKMRGVMGWMLEHATAEASVTIQQKVRGTFLEVMANFISVPDPEPGVDVSGITSVAVEGYLGASIRDKDWHVRNDPETILAAAAIAVDRMDELRGRERDRIIDLLIEAGETIDGAPRKQLGEMLVTHFRPSVVGDDPEALVQKMAAGGAMAQINKLLAIDGMMGEPGGWEVLGSTPTGEQVWWHTSFEPSEKPYAGEHNRYRDVEVPARLAHWYQADYDPAKHGWKRQQAATVGDVTPDSYAVSKEWFADHIGTAGEVVFLQKRFNLDDLDFASMRLTVYCRQGYDVYLNGERLVSKKGRAKHWGGRTTYFNEAMKQHLKVGENVVAVRSFLQYFRGLDGGVDVYVEKLEALPPVE